MARRVFLSALGLTAARPVGKATQIVVPQPGGDPDDAQEATWSGLACPDCTAIVYFLPKQRRNTCAWCERVVRRGLGK